MSTPKKKSASKQFLVNASSSVVARLIQITALVWVNQYLLRRIVPEEYAIYPVVLSLLVAGEIFSRIFTGGITRYIIEKDAKNDPEGVTEIVSSMVPLLFGAAFVLASLGSVVVWKINFFIQVDPLFVSDTRLMLSLLVLGVCVNILSTPFAAGLYVKQKFVTLNIVELLVEIVRVGLMASLLVGVSTRVLWLVVASTVAIFVRLIINRYYTAKLIPATRFKISKINFQTAKQIMGFGAWTSTSGLTGLMQRTGPFMLLNHFSTALDVTVFNLGRLIDLNIKRITQAAGQPLEPAMVRKFAEEGIEGLKSLYYRGGRYQLWILMVVVPPLVVFRREIVTLYVGEQYVAAGDVMLFYFLAYPFDYAGSMFYRVAHACGQVGEFYKIQMAVTVVSFLFSIGLVVFWDFGGVGIAIAFFLSSALMNVGFMWPAGLRMVEGSAGQFFHKILWRGCLPVILASGVCFGIKMVMPPEGWFQVFGYSFVSLLVYAGTIYGLCMDPADRILVRKGLGGIRKKLGV